MPTTATHTRPGYAAVKGGNEFRIVGVPIFVECTRGDFKADAQWVKKAVDHAKLQQRDNYYPPVHIVHHGDGNVQHAGWFEITHAAPITLQKKRLTAVFADLVLTNPDAADLVQSKRLPYRSVEIFDPEGSPAIDTLALLDHEPPFHELPMLFVRDVEEQEPATFSSAWTLEQTQTQQGPMTCIRRFQRRNFSDQERQTMAEHITTSTTFGAGVIDPDKAPIVFADDDKPKDKDDGEKQEGDDSATLDVSAVVKAIQSGDISVNDMDAILAAIQAQGGEAAPDEEQPAPAAVPGGEAMTKNPELTERFAKISGENEALKARLDERDELDSRTKDVNEAMQLLDGRPMGADFEGKLIAFHKEHGAKAFKTHVESIEQTSAVFHGDAGKKAAFTGQNGNLSESVMHYQKDGTDAVEKAAKFSADWKELSGRGMTRMPEARYLAVNMALAATKEN